MHFVIKYGMMKNKILSRINNYIRINFFKTVNKKKSSSRKKIKLC